MIHRKAVYALLSLAALATVGIYFFIKESRHEAASDPATEFNLNAFIDNPSAKLVKVTPYGNGDVDPSKSDDIYVCPKGMLASKDSLRENPVFNPNFTPETPSTISGYYDDRFYRSYDSTNLRLSPDLTGDVRYVSGPLSAKYAGQMFNLTEAYDLYPEFEFYNLRVSASKVIADLRTDNLNMLIGRYYQGKSGKFLLKSDYLTSTGEFVPGTYFTSVASTLKDVIVCGIPSSNSTGGALD